MTLSQQAALRDARITVSVEVANIGEFDGDEVVQLYVRFPQGGVKRPLRQLHGFKKVFIEKGRMAIVELPLKIGDLTFWDTKARQLVVEPGEFHIQAGPASDRILLTERLTVK
ncbi:MAG: fibronectin type III-like domain-contianing protein [Lentisphaerota bacterium]